MDVKDTLSLEKQSQDLINLLRKKWEKEGFYFKKDLDLKAKTDSLKINPLVNHQKLLDFIYYDDWISFWNRSMRNFEEDLFEQIQFIHRNRLDVIFKKHQSEVLKLLNELKSFNKSALEKYSHSFSHLDSTIIFWESLSEMQWNVNEIDFNFFKEKYNTIIIGKGEARGEGTDYYCKILLNYGIGRVDSINKTRIGADFAKNIPVPLGNLFSKNKKSKLYYRDLLEKSLIILTSYGFFIREKKKGQEDSFHPTLFLRMHEDIFTKGFNIEEYFSDLNTISLNKFSTNYCNLNNIELEHSSEIKRNLSIYIDKLIECYKAKFTASQFHLAHKLAANESGIVLVKKVPQKTHDF